MRKFVAQGYGIVLVGHKNHDEIVGTSGEAPERTLIVGSVDEARQLTVPDPEKVTVLTQTTLSVDDTREIIEVLKQRFPKLVRPAKEDICYATQNRQDAVKQLASKVDLVLVIGSKNSENSNQLVKSLRQDLLAFFERIGVASDELSNYVLSSDRKNSSEHHDYRSYYTPELAELVYARDREVIERFGFFF